MVGFAIFLSVVMMLGQVIGGTFGAHGALLGAAGLGLADVDAVTISLARMVPDPLGPFAASLAILAAVASNMVSKLAIAIFVGRGRFAVELVGLTVACWAIGLGALWGAMSLGAVAVSH